jgi:hypothetical protein
MSDQLPTRASFDNDRLPHPGETCAIAGSDLWKTTALLFDRVFVATPTTNGVEIGEVDIPAELTFGTRGISDDARLRLEFWLGKQPKYWPHLSPADVRAVVERTLVVTCQEHGIDSTPTFMTDAVLDVAYPTGKAIAYQAALRNIPVVDEAQVTWQQVLEFRADRNAVAKYRALRVWLRAGLRATTVQEAVDIIASRLDQYEWALKKHGLRTTSGLIELLVGPKSLSLVTATVGLSAVIGGPIFAALAGGLVVTAGVTAALLERKIEREALAREEFADIALLHEARNRFSS